MPDRLFRIDPVDVRADDRITVGGVRATVTAIGPRRITARHDTTGALIYLDTDPDRWERRYVRVPAPIDTTVPVDAAHARDTIRGRTLWRAAQTPLRTVRRLLGVAPGPDRDQAISEAMGRAATAATAGYAVRPRALITGAHTALCEAAVGNDAAADRALDLIATVGTAYLGADRIGPAEPTGRLLVSVDTPDGPLALGTIADDPDTIEAQARTRFGPRITAGFYTRPLCADELAHYPA